jgi:hypothetical protein
MASQYFIYVAALFGTFADNPLAAQWVTDNGAVIFDNGFESDAVGSLPSTPSVGALQVLSSGTSTIGVNGPMSSGPGAAVGTNYMSVQRPDAGTHTPPGLAGTFAQPINIGDELVLDVWVWNADVLDNNFIMGFNSDDTTTKLWLSAVSAPGATAGTFRTQLLQGNATPDLTDVTFTPNTWQEWKLDWVVGSSQAIVTINGVSETRTGLDPGDLPGDGGSAVSKFEIFGSNWPTTFYIDAAQYKSGDVTHDNIVNGLDINVMASHWLAKGAGTPGDANGDGIVNGLDINVIATQWLQTTTVGTYQTPPPVAPVPEPAAVTLLALGVVCAGILGRQGLRRD